MFCDILMLSVMICALMVLIAQIINFLQNINKLELTEIDAVSKKKGFKGPGHKQSGGQ